MAFKITPPIEKTFSLDRCDVNFPPDPADGDPEAAKPTTVTIVQAASGAIAARNDLFSVFKRKYEKDGSVEVTQRLSFSDIRIKEIFLTLKACNIRAPKGGLLFTFVNGKLADEVKFKEALALVPQEVVDEIHEKVLEMNPVWADLEGTQGSDEENPL